MHSSEDRNGLPDIELSVCKEGSAASLGSAATPVNCAKTKECLSSCAGRVAVSAKNADAKATPSELADIAKLIKEHERDNEEIKKQKETGKSSGNQRPVSTESTLQSQQQKWKKKSKDQKPKSGDKSGKKSPASTDVAKKWAALPPSYHTAYLHFYCNFYLLLDLNSNWFVFNVLQTLI